MTSTSTPHPSAPVTAMLCPACLPRYAGLIDPGCPCCAGLGALVLAPKALEREHPGVIARAVQMYLREFLGPFWRSKEGAPAALRIAVQALVDVDFLVTAPATDTPSVAEPHNRREIGLHASKIAKQLGVADGYDQPVTPGNGAPPIQQSPLAALVVDELAERRGKKAR